MPSLSGARTSSRAAIAATAPGSGRPRSIPPWCGPRWPAWRKGRDWPRASSGADRSRFRRNRPSLAFRQSEVLSLQEDGMSEVGEHPAAAFLRSITVDETATVSLKRVVRQRAVFANLYAATLLQPSLDVLLDDACRVASEGCDAPFAKVLEHLPLEGQFIVRAGIGWKPGVVGQAR